MTAKPALPLALPLVLGACATTYLYQARIEAPDSRPEPYVFNVSRRATKDLLADAPAPPCRP